MIFRRNRADLDLFETLFLRTCPFHGASVYIGLFGWIFFCQMHVAWMKFVYLLMLGDSLAPVPVIHLIPIPNARDTKHHNAAPTCEWCHNIMYPSVKNWPRNVYIHVIVYELYVTRYVIRISFFDILFHISNKQGQLLISHMYLWPL